MAVMAMGTGHASQRIETGLFFITGGNLGITRVITEGAVAAAAARNSESVVMLGRTIADKAYTADDVRGIILSSCPADFYTFVRRAAYPYPVINVSNADGPVPGLGNLLSDDRAVGRMAAAYLRRAGYRHFLVVAMAGSTGHAERAEGFVEGITTSGLPVSRGEISLRSNPVMPFRHTDYFGQMREAVGKYLESLPLGAGIFASNDEVALFVLQVLKHYYPEHLDTSGVLGVDNDADYLRYYGQLPGISSIEPAFRDIGAAAMNWLLDHPGAAGRKEAGQLHRRFAPKRVIARASTASGGCGDPLTARVIRWTWERIRRGEGVQVADMARAHRLNRKTLERRFGDHAGCTPGELILRLRLDKARDLLRNTRLTVAEISESCGFAKQDVLSRAMRREQGCTPLEFRRGGPG
jgi:LacI family transcriptional regulator